MNTIYLLFTFLYLCSQSPEVRYISSFLPKNFWKTRLKYIHCTFSFQKLISSLELHFWKCNSSVFFIIIIILNFLLYKEHKKKSTGRKGLCDPNPQADIGLLKVQVGKYPLLIGLLWSSWVDV